MTIYPAIDLRYGECVRLKQGDFNRKTVYEVDVVDMAESFQLAGATWIHVVDLDGAVDTKGDNLKAIAGIVGLTKLNVQVGGGVRSLKRIEALLALGAKRVILGTMPIEDPEMFKQALEQFGPSLAVAIDVLDNRVKTRGWQAESDWHIDAYVQHLEKLGVKTIIVTDIQKDGMLEGSNLDLYKRIVGMTSMQVIASGGISTQTDVETLRVLGVEGAIIGKALYEGHLDLRKVL